MQKRIFLLAVVILVVMLVSSCVNEKIPNEQENQSNPTSVTEQDTNTDGYSDSEIHQTLSDWVLGSDYGIKEAKFDINGKTLEIIISGDDYAKLADYEFTDIKNSIDDILYYYEIKDEILIMFSNGESLEANVIETQIQGNEKEQKNEENPLIINENGETVNLIFIHHSVGENWLNAGLNQMLNNNSIHVADTYYGWNEMGDRTDTADWPDWFNDGVMPTVYNELGNMTGYNAIEPAAGENTIIMFKSCYPNSDVGNSIDDEQQIYLSLLDYFSLHTDKMFVLITSPPMQNISNAKKTRELANWLVAEDGWRKDYTGDNLFVFDFYNVLTAEDNHHMIIDGQEMNVINDTSNTLYYDSSGDDHPNDEGSYKAAEEFVPLLMYWYEGFTN